jgi:hypothetical protein
MQAGGTVRENGGGLRPVALAVRRPVMSAALTVRRRYRHWWWLPGWLFAAMTQLPALLAIAWLVPGMALLLAGRLMPVPMLIISVPLAAALCYFTMRRLPVSWPRFRPGSADLDLMPRPPAARRPDVPVDAVIAPIVVAVGFAVWSALKHSVPILTTSDPGVYLQYGLWIAHHGSAKIPEAATAFGSAGVLNFTSFGFFPNGASLTPAFMPGLPIVLAGGAWISGISGAVLIAPVIAGGAIMSFAGVAGRLVGPRWAAPAALVLALTLPEQYTGRTTLSEPLVQLLVFGGLCLIIDSLAVPPRRHVYGGMPGGSMAPAAAMTLAGVGGFAFGLTVLVWIGSLSFLLPVFPVLALMFVARRPQAGPMALGVFLGAGCGLAAGLVISRPYLSSLSSELHLFGLCAAGAGVVTVLVAPLGFPKVRLALRRLFVARPRVWWPGGSRRALPSLASCLQWVVFAVPVLVLIGFAVRPYVQTVRSFSDPSVVQYVAALQRLARVRVDGRRSYYETSLSWVVWYLGVPGVLLGCAGAALLGRRLVRGVYLWRTSPAAARLWGLAYLVVGWSVVTVLWDPAVLPGQPSAARRLVPVVLPGLVLLALWACCQLKAWSLELGARRVTSWAVGVCCVLALAVPAFWSSFAPSVTSSGVTFRGAAVSRTGLGSVTAATSLCSAIGTNASVVFVDAVTADYFASVVRGMCGQPAAIVLGGGTGTVGSGSAGSGSAGSGGGGSAAIEQEVTSIENAGRRPVLLGGSASSLSVLGVTPREAVSLRTRTDEATLTGPPAGTLPFSYTVWMATPVSSPSGV